MNYTTDDIKFEQLSPTEFERLCYELLIKYGYTELSWRQGGADNGRDIEGYLNFTNQIHTKKTKWFFECKHYTSGGVPPEHLNSKITWADAEIPSSLVIFTSSYITTGAKVWLEKIKGQKSYDLIVIEGQELKNRIIQFPDLVERFFTEDRYEKLFLDIKKHWFHYKIDPSYESIREVTNNINIEKLSLNDIGFLLILFHKNYRHFETRNEYYGDFNVEVIAPIFDQLFKLSSLEKLESFDDFKSDYGYLDGIGCFDDAENEEHGRLAFQYYTLHLNEKKEQEFWKLGHYLFMICMGGAFELFTIENSEFTTHSKFYPKYTPEILKELALDISLGFGEKILEYNPILRSSS